MFFVWLYENPTCFNCVTCCLWNNESLMFKMYFTAGKLYPKHCRCGCKWNRAVTHRKKNLTKACSPWARTNQARSLQDVGRSSCSPNTVYNCLVWQASLYFKRPCLNELPSRLRRACQLNKARLIRKVGASQARMKKKQAPFSMNLCVIGTVTLHLPVSQICSLLFL